MIKTISGVYPKDKCIGLHLREFDIVLEKGELDLYTPYWICGSEIRVREKSLRRNTILEKKKLWHICVIVTADAMNSFIDGDLIVGATVSDKNPDSWNPVNWAHPKVLDKSKTLKFGEGLVTDNHLGAFYMKQQKEQANCKHNLYHIVSILKFGHGDSSTYTYATCENCDYKTSKQWSRGLLPIEKNIHKAQKELTDGR